MTPALVLDLTTSLRGDSIAFGSAPRREAGSQPISQLVRPAGQANQSVSQASSQSDSQSGKRAGRQTKTHSLGFFLVADLASSSGENRHRRNKQRSSGKAAGRRRIGRWFELLGELFDLAVSDGSKPAGNRTADLRVRGRLHYHSAAACSEVAILPTARNLLSTNF